MSVDINELLNHIPFVKKAGVLVTHSAPGEIDAEIPLTEFTTNHFNTMYAGAIYTLAEVVGGCMCFASFDIHKYFPIVTKMTIKFIKPVRSNLFVKCRWTKDELNRISQDLKTNGRSKFNWTLDLTDEGGQVVSSVDGYYQIHSVGSKL